MVGVRSRPDPHLCQASITTPEPAAGRGSGQSGEPGWNNNNSNFKIALFSDNNPLCMVCVLAMTSRQYFSPDKVPVRAIDFLGSVFLPHMGNGRFGFDYALSNKA